MVALIGKESVSPLPSKTSDLSVLAKSHLYIFFLLGQHSFNPYADDSKHTLFSKINHYMPSAFFTLLTYSTGVFAFYGIAISQLSFDNAIYCLFITNTVITSSAVIRHTPIFDNTMKALWMKFEAVEHIANQRLKFRMSFNEFRESYYRKIRIILIFFLSLVCIKVTIRVSRKNYIRQVSSMLLVLFTLLANFQILFYVSLLTHIIREINRNVYHLFQNKIQEIDFWSVKIFIESFKNFKQLHYKLWEITYILNEKFGWILVSLTLQNINNIIQPVYWIIVELHEDDIPSNLRILSKYMIFL